MENFSHDPDFSEAAGAAQDMAVRSRCCANADYREEFDGIWACASLVHVPHVEIDAVLRRFAEGLKLGGVLYVSLKEAHGERITKDGLLLNYYSLKEFGDALERAESFEAVTAWKSKAVDSSGHMQTWLNFLFRKAG